MNIGLKIRELMSKEKIDAPTLAKNIGKTKQAVYDILDKEDLNTSLLRKLAKVFNVPITYFFTDDAESIDSQVELENLRKEVEQLRDEVNRLRDIKFTSKNERLYELWMQFMKNQQRHQEIMSEMASLYASNYEK